MNQSYKKAHTRTHIHTYIQKKKLFCCQVSKLGRPRESGLHYSSVNRYKLNISDLHNLTCSLSPCEGILQLHHTSHLKPWTVPLFIITSSPHLFPGFSLSTCFTQFLHYYHEAKRHVAL